MGIEPYLIAAVLKGAFAQRLVRKICENCRERVSPSRRELGLFKKYNLKVDSLFRGKGCKLCNGTGYRGRTGIFELFQTDDNIEEMILRGKKDSEIKTYMVSKGMKPLIINGLQKTLEGVTTVDELERVLTE